MVPSDLESHSVVLAKLSPASDLSIHWVPPIIRTAAICLEALAKPFVALRVWAHYFYPNPEEYNSSIPQAYLLPISTQKPTGIFSGLYLTLTPHPTSNPREFQLQPFPPIGKDKNLFLHTAPVLQVVYGRGPPMESLASPYQLMSMNDLKALITCVMSDVKVFKKSFIEAYPPSSGGHDEVEDDWASWSGQSAKERFSDPRMRYFHYVPFDDEYFRAQVTIRNECELMRQYVPFAAHTFSIYINSGQG